MGPKETRASGHLIDKTMSEHGPLATCDYTQLMNFWIR
jgi:hypothetical protein